MSQPTEYRVEILPHNESLVHTRLFGSNSLTDLVAAVQWMIDMLPTEMDKATARVSLMMLLKHPSEDVKRC